MLQICGASLCKNRPLIMLGSWIVTRVCFTNATNTNIARFTISSSYHFLQTWYIICLTRANKHFEAQYQLNKWATSLGLHSSEEEEDFEQEAAKGYPIWLDTKMQVSMENQLSVGDMKNIDVLLEKKEQEAVIWLLSEYRILRSRVEGEQGKDRSSLQQARQASKILEGYALFQEKQDNVHLDDTNVLQDIQNTEKSTDQSRSLEQQYLKTDRDFRLTNESHFMRGVCLLLIFWK